MTTRALRRMPRFAAGYAAALVVAELGYLALTPAAASAVSAWRAPTSIGWSPSRSGR